jgi:hypothetical protein
MERLTLHQSKGGIVILTEAIEFAKANAMAQSQPKDPYHYAL